MVLGGTGGVGKTTLSAAVGLHFALEGQRVALLTIDPARRLGATLGFRKWGSGVRRISDAKLNSLRKKPGGSLSAAMLDVKTTFDDMVGRYAPSKMIRDQILKNRFYGELSHALSGTHDYMAIEKIYQIVATGEYDLVILDTPPSSAMSDFLDAPKRLRSFLDREVVRWFFPRQNSGWKGLARAAMAKGMEQTFAALDKLAGSHVFEDIAQLLNEFQSLFDGLRDRTAEVERLLHAKETTFFLVVTSDRGAMDTLDKMAAELRRRKLQIGGIFLNRVLPELTIPAKKPGEENPLRKAAETMLARQDEARKKLDKKFSGLPRVEVPLQEYDPSSLSQLADLLATWE